MTRRTAFRPQFLLLAITIIGALVAVGIVAAGLTDAQSGSMQAMSVDTDVTGNDATTLGANDPCVQTTAGSDVTIDITALAVPASNPMIAYNYNLNYDPTVFLSVTAQDTDGLLSTAPGYSPFNASDSKPDADGHFNASVIDINAAGVSGSGRLDRLTIHVGASAPTGQYTLLLTNAVDIDTSNNTWVPDALNHGAIAIGQACGPIVTPTPTPSPTPMPTPTPSPTPAPFYPGDVDCDTHINSVDALKVLRHVVGLPVTGNCASFNGDIDCNGMQNSVDALKILRYVVGLPNTLPNGCPPIGP